MGSFICIQRMHFHILHTHAHGIANVRFLPTFVYVSVFLHDISKTDVAKITKLDIQMFHNELWKPFNFVVKRSRI